MNSTIDKHFESAKQVFRRFGGILKTGDALKQDIHRRTLYAMRDSGDLERFDRGLCRPADLPALSVPELVAVALKVPDGVICLISDLRFHEITTQIPHAVRVALKRGAQAPRLAYPPTRKFWFSGKAFTTGIEQNQVDDTMVRVYSAEKTLADCFKYRNKIGKGTVLESLTLYRERKKPRLRVLNHFARICRV